MLFDTYASTKDPGAKRGILPPLEISDSPTNVFDTIKRYLEDNQYTNIVAKQDYFDLFGVKDDYEISFNVINNNGKSMLQISVYSEIKKGRVKKRLRIIYEEMVELFDKYL